MRYFKRRWDESRGDAYDHWGVSTWWFAVDASGRIVRQLEVYDSGPDHLYDLEHAEDECGGLGEQFDVVEFEPYEIRRLDSKKPSRLTRRATETDPGVRGQSVSPAHVVHPSPWAKGGYAHLHAGART